MLQAMYNGVSGLQAEQQWMDVIGNNIANVNTTGYKSSDVSFEDQLSQTLQGASGASGNVGGTDPIQEGLGVAVGAIGTNTSQGGLQATSVPTDMAISGNGYFMLGGSGGGVSYTRDGSFSLDNQGDLVSANGAPVLGWTANNQGVLNTTSPITATSGLTLPIGAMTITNPTSSASFSGNLSADTPDSTNPTGTYTRSVNVYDSLGEKQPVTLTFNNVSDAPAQPTAAAGVETGTLTDPSYGVQVSFVYPNGTGSIESPASQSLSVAPSADGSIDLSNINLPAGATGFNVYVDGALNNSSPETGTTYSVTDASTLTQAPPSAPATPEWTWSAADSTGTNVGSGTISFGSDGTESGSTGSVSVGTTDGSGTPVNVALDFSSVTADAGASSASPLTVNGSGPGTLQSFSVDDTGTITGVFSNGVNQTLGQVALASFENPEGLSSNGENNYSTTADSGNATIGAANSNGLGSLATGYVEQSNVDLSNEFTNMIVSQRGFEANTKIVSTVDTLLSDVIGLIQG